MEEEEEISDMLLVYKRNSGKWSLICTDQEVATKIMENICKYTYGKHSVDGLSYQRLAKRIKIYQ